MFIALTALLTIFQMIYANDVENCTAVAANIYDDAALKEILHRLDLLQTTNENLRLKIDSLSLLMDQQFAKQDMDEQFTNPKNEIKKDVNQQKDEFKEDIDQQFIKQRNYFKKDVDQQQNDFKIFIDQQFTKQQNEYKNDMDQQKNEFKRNVDELFTKQQNEIKKDMDQQFTKHIDQQRDGFKEDMDLHFAKQQNEIKKDMDQQQLDFKKDIDQQFIKQQYEFEENMSQQLAKLQNELKEEMNKQFTKQRNDFKKDFDQQCSIKQNEFITEMNQQFIKQRNEFKKDFEVLKEPSNCVQAFEKRGQSGIYKIKIKNSELEPFDVYCLSHIGSDLEKNTVTDNSSNAAWMVIQRRQDGTVDFNRNWTDYQDGFGDLNGEFFIGLDKLHEVTQSTLHELWVQMEDFEGSKRWAKYSRFAIGGENESYILNDLGAYTGDAGDSLSCHAGQKWTTKDVDTGHGYCAIHFNAGWWYEDCFCSNINGIYLHHPKATYGEGITWNEWHGDYYSLKYVHMAIRPVQ